MVEGIQGEGGVYVATPDYLLGLRKLADAKNLLLLMDGVQCGFFRTGRWQSYQRILENTPGGESFRPDAIAMAKSLGAGFPIGAVWIREPYQDVFTPRQPRHDLRRIAAGLLGRAHRARRGRAGRSSRTTSARGATNSSPGWRSWSARALLEPCAGYGGLVGFELEKEEPASAVARLTEAGLILIPAANKTVRVLAPFNVTSAEIAEALAIIEKTL